MKLIRLCVRATGRAASAAKNVLKRLILEPSKRINPSLWEVLYQMLMELSFSHPSITDHALSQNRRRATKTVCVWLNFIIQMTNVTKWGYFCIKLLSLVPASASYVEKWAIIPLMRAAGCWFYLILNQLLRKPRFESLKQYLKLKWKSKEEYFSCCEVRFEAKSGICSLDIEALFPFTAYRRTTRKIAIKSIRCRAPSKIILIKPWENGLFPEFCPPTSLFWAAFTFVIPVLYIKCNIVFLLSFQGVLIAHDNHIQYIICGDQQ